MTFKKCLCLFTSVFPVEVHSLLCCCERLVLKEALIHSPRENVWNAYAFWGKRLVTGVFFTLFADCEERG